MDITVATPGSPGTTFTDNVKNQIVVIHHVVNNYENIDSVGELRKILEKNYGFKQAYTRNILAFLRNCGIVSYISNVDTFDKSNFFTNIGNAYVDILKCIEIAQKEKSSPERDTILDHMKKIDEIIYFQSLVIMMKKKDCTYAADFFNVLRFVDKYQYIDSTEYLLIQYMREKYPNDFLARMKDIVTQYRDGSIIINVKTNTKNDSSGGSKSVNSFPYVHGNFTKAGVLIKNDSNQFYFNESRRQEIDKALVEVEKIWQNSAM